MIVVADSSPLIVLISIGHVHVLPALFQRVVIPPAVASELKQDNRPPEVKSFMQSRPEWITVEQPDNPESIPHLHQGECEAIALARKLNADLLLIDETAGRRAAIERALPIAGTIGILERAAVAGFLDLADAFERVKRTDFWISHRLLDERLDAYRRRSI